MSKREDRSGRLNGLALVVAVTALAGAARAAGQVLPVPKNHVEDRAGVIDQGVFQRLDGYLTELEQKTGFQMIVLTIDTTAGKPIREFALQHAEAWKLGRRGKDNGVLIVVAVKDRRYAIENGYGAEGILPDAFCDAVARQYFVPNFRRGDYAQGIYEGTLALANRVAKEEGVRISGMPARTVARQGRAGGVLPCISSLIPLIVIIVIFSAASRRRRAYGMWGGGISPWWLLLLLGGGRGHFHGGGWGGGGFGGGGFGGGGFGGGSFGGGGGGGFGGGGVSGGW